MFFRETCQNQNNQDTLHLRRFSFYTDSDQRELDWAEFKTIALERAGQPVWR
ncbi:MAG: hypothetical protein ACRC10_09430 [Thermoguttaceae bacterium]